MSKIFTIAEGLENLGALRTGGQGSVYKGRRTGLIYSAVKLIPTPVYSESGDDKNYRNFQNEVAKLQKVNEIPNPNIVKMLSFGITESGSFPYIEMEYIEGPDLSELLHPPHAKIFTLKELLKVADQLACALAHCHTVGVKHGDLKSNNVKYNNHTGNYVLLDFGLAIMTDEQRRSSIRNAGAIEFMAPEQHNGVMLTQTDVYSYGVILYELLAGQVPFPLPGNGDSGRNGVMLKHLEEEIPDPVALRKANLPEHWDTFKSTLEMQVPEWLLKLVYKCLAKEPQGRYADGNELHKAIIDGRLATPRGEISPIAIANIPGQNEQPQVRSTGLNDPEKVGVMKVDGDVVHISKGLFAAIVAIALLFMGLFAYSSLFRKQQDGSNFDPYAYQGKVNPYQSVMFIRSYNFDSVKRAREHIKFKADSIAAARALIVERKKAASLATPPKKRRKKFLGIF